MEKQESTMQGPLRPLAIGQGVARGCAWPNGALVLALLVCAALVLGCSTAYADDEAGKHALPSIEKAVSLDGKSWGEGVTSKAGGKVFYRLTMTLSETVADDAKADYVVTDKPAKEVQVKKDSVKASVVDRRGNEKALLSPDVQVQDGVMKIALGDLKELVPNLKYGDRVQVVYEATVSDKAPAGRYQNVAKLSYDRGDGFRDTVEVRALVDIPEQPQQSSGKESLPKTGDVLPGWVYFAVGGLLTASIVALVAATTARRKGKERG